MHACVCVCVFKNEGSWRRESWVRRVGVRVPLRHFSWGVHLVTSGILRVGGRKGRQRGLLSSGEALVHASVVSGDGEPCGPAREPRWLWWNPTIFPSLTLKSGGFIPKSHGGNLFGASLSFAYLGIFLLTVLQTPPAILLHRRKDRFN